MLSCGSQGPVIFEPRRCQCRRPSETGTSAQERSSLGRVIPTCIVLVLCEAVGRPTPTGEAFVLRAFDFFEVASSPSRVKPFTVWMQLRNGNGGADMLLVVDHTSGRPRSCRSVAVQFSLLGIKPGRRHQAVFDNGLRFRSRVGTGCVAGQRRLLCSATSPWCEQRRRRRCRRTRRSTRSGPRLADLLALGQGGQVHGLARQK